MCIALLLLAKRGRRKYRRYQRGNVDETQNLTTLAANTGVKNALTGIVTERTWLSSLKLFHSLSQFTPITNAGPLQVYITHSGYSLAEIEEYIEAAGATSWDLGNKAQQEIMSRGKFIKLVGQYTVESTDAVETVHTLNDGKPITTKCGWMLETGQTAALFYYNAGVAAFATTVPVVQAVGHANLWPK